MKTFLGRSGACAGTLLLTGSLILTAQPSLAETFLYQEQTKSESTQTQSSNSVIHEASSTTEPGTLKGKVTEKPEESTALEAEAPEKEPVSYVATAYSLRGRTASGRYVGPGIIAADPRVLPLGSRVRVEAGSWSGEYLVADTGGRIKGRKIDIWIPSARQAMRFGRRVVKLTVLSYGARRSRAKRSR